MSSDHDVQAIAAGMLAASLSFTGLRQRKSDREHEQRFQRDVNQVVDAVYLRCQGDMRETAVMLCAALISTLRSLPQASARHTIAQMLHAALYLTCSSEERI